MDLHGQLRELGLSASEIRVYLYVLEKGLSSPSVIAKGIGMQRPNTYHVLQSLIEKGLLLEQRQGTRKAYLTSDPESLLVSLQRKRDLVETILPDLRGLRKAQPNKPTIRFFDGLSQIEEIYRLALHSQEIIALGSTDRLYQLMPTFFQSWLKEIKHREIMLRDIVTHVSGSAAAHKTVAALKGYYDAKVLPKSVGELTTDLLLWDDHLALITLEEPYFGTIITNPSLAKTFRKMLDFTRQML